MHGSGTTTGQPSAHSAPAHRGSILPALCSGAAQAVVQTRVVMVAPEIAHLDSGFANNTGQAISASTKIWYRTPPVPSMPIHPLPASLDHPTSEPIGSWMGRANDGRFGSTIMEKKAGLCCRIRHPPQIRRIGRLLASYSLAGPRCNRVWVASSTARHSTWAWHTLTLVAQQSTQQSTSTCKVRIRRILAYAHLACCARPTATTVDHTIYSLPTIILRVGPGAKARRSRLVGTVQSMSIVGWLSVQVTLAEY
ncbi:hypothetical protein S40285_10477 [Stachybotrys chlorohalonatus IBT 40285]|uniref:Uncharacterized protein n=1 Tax=Stachybotrys chlorohalonatus (strain IBT 40285) TaxID=1283841 RepID=A0A084QN12_STAC4|nr:hypothetical protein S40285_10477 [Stachybotrys chlorohalonata IBT 40285]